MDYPTDRRDTPSHLPIDVDDCLERAAPSVAGTTASLTADSGPSIAGKETANHRQPLSIRLSEIERAALKAAAGRRQTLSAFIRRAALSKAGRPLPPSLARRDALAQEAAKFVGLLGRIGNLSNQIAHAGNSGRLGAGDVQFALDRLTRELSKLREEILCLAEEERNA